ncbi:DedA family protein [Cryptosporangium arvum]|uniref:DedA family protein n=1 Tax=Cryptosporangium arvum TaxID=80871 RepID=UPI000561D157|nr:DedA family protein [Cryptosporangium arvum]
MDSITALVSDYGYLGLAVLVAVEGFAIPAPGQTAVVLAAGLAGTGKLNVVGVGLVAFAAAVTGDNIGYWIGRKGGRPLILRFGRYVRLTEQRLDRVEAFLSRRGSVVVTIARFVDGMRQLGGLVAGATGMPWRRYVVFDAIGAALWAGTWTTAGYLVGGHLPEVEATLRRYQWFVVALVVVLAAGWFVLRRVRRRHALAGPRVERGERDS